MRVFVLSLAALGLVSCGGVTTADLLANPGLLNRTVTKCQKFPKKRGSDDCAAALSALTQNWQTDIETKEAALRPLHESFNDQMKVCRSDRSKGSIVCANRLKESDIGVSVQQQLDALKVLRENPPKPW